MPIRLTISLLNKRTKPSCKKTQRDVRLLQAFTLETNNEIRKVKDIPATELNECLCEFILVRVFNSLSDLSITPSKGNKSLLFTCQPHHVLPSQDWYRKHDQALCDITLNTLLFFYILTYYQSLLISGKLNTTFEYWKPIRAVNVNQGNLHLIFLCIFPFRKEFVTLSWRLNPNNFPPFFLQTNQKLNSCLNSTSQRRWWNGANGRLVPRLAEEESKCGLEVVAQYPIFENEKQK